MRAIDDVRFDGYIASGAVIVGNVDGNRIWSKEIGNDLRAVTVNSLLVSLTSTNNNCSGRPTVTICSSQWVAQSTRQIRRRMRCKSIPTTMTATLSCVSFIYKHQSRSQQNKQCSKGEQKSIKLLLSYFVLSILREITSKSTLYSLACRSSVNSTRKVSRLE